MTSTPIVLFVGIDASSTQIAESLLRRLIGDRAEIHTAGAQPSNPGGREDQMLVMMGLNPAHEEPLSLRALNTSDRVIILGTSLDVARVPYQHYEEWDLDDRSLEERVEALAAELTSSEAPDNVARPKDKRGRVLAQHILRDAITGASQRQEQLARRLASARRRYWPRRRRSGPNSEFPN